MSIKALTCIELVELVTEYLEGTLPEIERTRFEEHLSGCEGCTNYLEQMRQTVRLTGKLTTETVEPEAKQTLLTIFRNWKKED
jgi:predicted anti-sigma-YlaC factor YlaD